MRSLERLEAVVLEVKEELGGLLPLSSRVQHPIVVALLRATGDVLVGLETLQLLNKDGAAELGGEGVPFNDKGKDE